MATRIEDLVIRLTADNVELRKALGLATAEIAKFSGKTSSQFDRMNAAATRFQRTVIGIFSAQAIGRGVLTFVQSLGEAALALDRANFALVSVLGSSAAARQEFDFVARVSERLGLELLGATENYVKLAAAAKGTNIEGQKTRDLFEALSVNIARLGLSADDTNGILKAMVQIISKGKLSAEELRQQLGERFPGALRAAERALGLTSAELDKALQDGKISAEIFVNAFTAELQRMATGLDGRITSMQASLNRLSNAWLRTQKRILDAGFGEEIQKTLDALAKAIESPEFIRAVSDLGERMAWLAQQIVKAIEQLDEFLGVFDQAAFKFGGQSELGRIDNTDLEERLRVLKEMKRVREEPNGFLDRLRAEVVQGTRGLGGEPFEPARVDEDIARIEEELSLRRLAGARLGSRVPYRQRRPTAAPTDVLGGGGGADKAAARAAKELARDLETLKDKEEEWTRQALQDADLRREALQVEHEARVRYLDQFESKGRDVREARLAEERLFAAELNKLDVERIEAYTQLENRLKEQTLKTTKETSEERRAIIAQELIEDFAQIDKVAKNQQFAAEQINALRIRATKKAEAAIQAESAKTWEKAAQFAKDTLSDALAEVVTSGEGSFDQLRESFFKTLVKMGTDVFASGLIDSLQKLLSAGGGALANSATRSSAGGGGAGGAALGIFASILGAIFLADGGIVKKPTLAVLGEGGEAEAVIPLSKLQGTGSGVTVNVVNQGEPLDVVAQSRRRTSAGDIVELVVRRSVRAGLARGEYSDLLGQKHAPGVG